MQRQLSIEREQSFSTGGGGRENPHRHIPHDCNEDVLYASYDRPKLSWHIPQIVIPFSLRVTNFSSVFQYIFQNLFTLLALNGRSKYFPR